MKPCKRTCIHLVLITGSPYDPKMTRPGAPVNAQYVYDTKFRQNAYGALLEEYSALFGPDHGKLLAVADSGPLDEAYVGGAS